MAQQAQTETFKVGSKYKCTIIAPPPVPGTVSAINFEWEPKVPTRLTKRMLRDYRKGRDDFFARQAAETDLKTVIYEV